MAPPRSDCVVVDAPCRISFVGGGTDLPEFYNREPGGVVSVTLKNGVTLKALRDENSAGSSRSNRDRTNPFLGGLARWAMARTDWNGALRLSSASGLPSASGLGSSSACCVALVHALSVLQSKPVEPGALAETAYALERGWLGAPVGKQDHYATAFGGLNYFAFSPDGAVIVERLSNDHEFFQALESSLLLFHIGDRSSADANLRQQAARMEVNLSLLREMRDCALAMRAIARSDHVDLENLGRLINTNWQLKRRLTWTMSNELVDELISSSLSAGAFGAKLLGSGGKGCLLVLADGSKHEKIRAVLRHPKEFRVGLRKQGSMVVTSASEAIDANSWLHII